jgi:NAD(P)-dependent dehydrogenase (short-subunit alcohol dehydrogenase family)
MQKSASIVTDLLKRMLTELTRGGDAPMPASNSPMAPAAKPEEMAGIVLFPCSPAASFVNGAVWLADGGMTAH